MNFKTTYLCTLACSLLYLGACNSNDNVSPEPPIIPEDTTVVPPVVTPDPILPVDFKYLTLNRQGSVVGDIASISFIDKQNSVIKDKFFEANNEIFAADPFKANLIKNDLYIIQGAYWNPSSIEVLDPNTLSRRKKINLNQDIVPYDIIHLNADSVLVVGKKNQSSYNTIIGDLDDSTFVRRTFDTELQITQAKKVGSKIIAGGHNQAKLVIFDINNLSPSGMRVIKAPCNLFMWSSEFVIDKNNIVWLAVKDNFDIKLLGVDTDKEAVIYSLDMPPYINALHSFAFNISNDGGTLYLRAHKAFFTVDVDNPQTPEDVVFEFTDMRNFQDLKVNQDGNLLFIDQIGGQNNPSKLFEITPHKDKDWQIVRELEVGCQANLIYVAPYEK